MIRQVIGLRRGFSPSISLDDGKAERFFWKSSRFIFISLLFSSVGFSFLSLSRDHQLKRERDESIDDLLKSIGQPVSSCEARTTGSFAWNDWVDCWRASVVIVDAKP